MQSKKIIKPGGVDEYISSFPKDIQMRLVEIRSIIKEVAIGATETTSYFEIPGYSYEGYKYNGMFAWFSVSENNVRLHVIPPVIDNHTKELTEYLVTKSIVNFPLDKELPVDLIKKLVKASLVVMKKSK